MKNAKDFYHILDLIEGSSGENNPQVPIPKKLQMKYLGIAGGQILSLPTGTDQRNAIHELKITCARIVGPNDIQRGDDLLSKLMDALLLGCHRKSNDNLKARENAVIQEIQEKFQDRNFVLPKDTKQVRALTLDLGISSPRGIQSFEIAVAREHYKRRSFVKSQEIIVDIFKNFRVTPYDVGLDNYGAHWSAGRKIWGDIQENPRFYIDNPKEILFVVKTYQLGHEYYSLAKKWSDIYLERKNQSNDNL